MNIDVSNEAYSNLYALLTEHSEYNCVRFSYVNSCCKKVTVDVILDEINPNDSLKKINDINFVYSNTLEEKIKTINLVYKDSSFLVKCEPVVQNKSCSNCGNDNKGCGGCGAKAYEKK
jgi:hypothetical protein